MHRNRINIEFIDTGQEPKTLLWPLKDIDHVEQLVYSILDSKGVGPVYRQLFGIRIVREPHIWLAPNDKTESLLRSHLGTSPGTLELRLRFRPSSFTKLLVLDKKAFEIIFAQIRHDFLHTKFPTTERKDLILLNESVLALITYDLIRHALENNIKDEEIFKCVKLDKFIPRKAVRWQRPLLYHYRNKLNLPKSIQVGFKSCDRNVMKVKQAIIELFLYDVCPDYSTEIYRVICVDNPRSPIEMDIRVRYLQTSRDSSCIVEGCLATQSSTREWFELCDIYTICYGTLREDTVEIDRISGKLLRVKFKSPREARSFISLIDGYYRLMRKWNFNFCCDVTSPDLELLKKIKCHGPIGFESTRLKLNRLKKPGSFIIRRCMENSSMFIIDVLLQQGLRLTIDIKWDCENRSYSMVGHSKNRAAAVDVYLNKSEYRELQLMVHDMQIKVEDPIEAGHPPQQLKHWIPPTEHDDCPALLLSIPKSKIAEYEDGRQKLPNSYTELPRVFPSDMLQPFGEVVHGIPNKLTVRAASLRDGQTVIIKEHADEGNHNKSNPKHDDLILYQDSRNNSSREFLTKLKPAQLRLTDWIFVKSHLVAETIGLDLTRKALIQEHLPLGPLDRYLWGTCDLPKEGFKSIIYQLASTLLFLQENSIVHGKLRCHNFLIKSLDPLQIKLTDPLGTFDAYRDRVYLPTEYSDHELKSKLDANGHLIIKEYDPSIDVWAFGVVLWQVFNMGRRPAPGQFANLLTKPVACPDKIWRIIDSCWAMEPVNRASPQKIFRDLNDVFAWQIGKDDYEYISGNKASDAAKTPPKTPEHQIYDPQTSVISCSTDATTKPDTSANSSQIDLISSRATSISSAPLECLIPSTLRVERVETRRQSIISWRKLFRYSDSSTGNSRTMVDYAEYQNASSISSRRSFSNCSTPSGSEDTKVTEVSNFTNTNGSSEHSDRKIDPSRIKMTTEIGRGNNGVVFKGILSQWGNFSEQVVAVKLLHKQEEHIEVNELKQEYDILRNLDHENIVKTLGLVGDGYSMMLIMEFMPLGSLSTRMKNMQPYDLLALPLQKYAHDIAKGMEYLENMRIVHRDLALRNILIKSYDEVKICDFGLARSVNHNNRYELQTDRPLPIKWYAPEVLENWMFTHQSDVWSYGIVLWEIYSGGDVPQYSGSYSNLMHTLRQERLLIPKGCPMRMYALMLRCWALNPQDRGNFTQICEHLESMENEGAFPTEIIDFESPMKVA